MRNMAGRKTKLTRRLIEEIAEKIRNGSWDYVAAESSGVSRRTFYLWLQQAESSDAKPLFLHFLHEVTEARAAARQDAEARIYNEDPFKWLRYGPGRHRSDGDGWTSESTVNVQGDATVITLQWDGQIEDGEGTDD